MVRVGKLHASEFPWASLRFCYPRQRRVRALCKKVTCESDKVRPHPDPLPQGEGTAAISSDYSALLSVSPLLTTLTKARSAARPAALVPAQRVSLPLLGERVGVRADPSLTSLSA